MRNTIFLCKTEEQLFNNMLNSPKKISSVNTAVNNKKNTSLLKTHFTSRNNTDQKTISCETKYLENKGTTGISM